MPTSATLAHRLIQLQSFKEVTWGTTGTATARWMALAGPPSFKPKQKSEIFSDDARGSLQNAFLSAILEQGGEFDYEAYATFEDLLFTLNGGLLSTTPTGVGPYVWAFAAPTTAAYALQSYTFNFAYDAATIQATGCIINKWGIKGEAKKPWMVSGSGFYKTHDSNGTLQAGINDRTVEVVTFPGTALALDPAAAAPGATAVTNSLLGFELNVENNIEPVAGSDALTPIAWTYGLVKPELKLKLLYTTAVKNWYRTNLEAGLGVVVQLKRTSGTKIAQIDFAGVLADDLDLYEEVNGAIAVNIALEGRYDTGTLANQLKVSVTNSVGTLP